MGTDIHLMLEVRRGGKWETVNDALIPNHWYREDGQHEWEKDKMIPVSEGGPRNYDAFAILGDVRNGTGFAGIKAGDGFTPLSSRRGIPEDTEKIVVYASDSEEDEDCEITAYLGEHSFSWLTLRELVADDAYWNQSTLSYGHVATYKEAAGYYYSQFIPALVEYAEERELSLDDVRLVFGFDS
jgi:hypothetical protein